MMFFRPTAAALAFALAPAAAPAGAETLSAILGAGQMTVKTPARRGPGLANRRIVAPTSSVETPTDVGLRAHNHLRILVESHAADAGPAAPRPSGAPYSGYLVETPASLACIYRLVAATPGCNPNNVTAIATGGSRMIALVDAYDLPSAAADLQTFSSQFGLPAASFQVVYASGTRPTVDAGWALEEALDIEMAHAMAPNARIVLVEAASAGFADLGVAIDTAYNLVQQAGGGQISMSFGGSEYSGEASFDAHFAKQSSPITFYASTGDSAGTEYPSTSPNVVAVGGTATSRQTLDAQGFGAFIQETAWADAGSGVSTVFGRPSYQRALARMYSYANGRAVPDVAAVASPYTPVWVYCGASCGASGWYTVAGTTASPRRSPPAWPMASDVSTWARNPRSPASTRTRAQVRSSTSRWGCAARRRVISPGAASAATTCAPGSARRAPRKRFEAALLTDPQPSLPTLPHDRGSERQMIRGEDTKLLLRRAIAGESLTIDSDVHSLHELTQIAAALREHANLAIRNAGLMSPIEQASVASVARGRIVFL